MLDKETGVSCNFIFANVLLLYQFSTKNGNKNRKMNAEDFYKMYKKGKRMENEYFIAVDKASLFEMMEAYAEIKLRNQGNINTKETLKKTSKKSIELLKHN